MSIPLWVWALSLLALLFLFAFDFISHVRKAHVPSLRESLLWSCFYIVLALLFGIGLFLTMGHKEGVSFIAGFVTEKSLSMDNLFVFAILMARFNVPEEAQQKALLIGILLALIIRGALIMVGGDLISRFSWIFYLFGLFLLYSAVKLIIEECSGEKEEEYQPNALIRYVQRRLSISPDFDGNRFVTRVEGKRWFTPLVIVVVALGLTDVMFALDSIPAIYGLTQIPYIVLMANAFALLGLVQLYFLLGGLLQKLVYLGVGLAAILAFIGVKLIMESLHHNQLPFIHHGLPLSWVPEISNGTSLGVIVGILLLTTVASLAQNRFTRH